MLTENHIINILADYLEKDGYKIIQKLTTQEKGVDIRAEKNGVTLYVEAKGETSSKESSNRHGKPFTKNQVGTHVSVALLTSLKVLSKDDKNSKKVAMAFPDNKNHREIIELIAPALRRTGIVTYLVKENSVIEI
ncbi:MAG: hypothetical protein A2534_04475 [Candidatus Magasanikbacteria bacterium RIFOXYD2_FULL_39_9]|uniref:Restriction endonuclease type IV Mrr domain-containing protein n=1 Tax=Candidatus Magasanikbacteria bacterium RIFOXYD1_FULL_40_23 TaxID=1798705 RepID=A0A1F6P7D4_9BACT|nr:MAG: hypothetical protein A2534_04475 [Candidatus Magasanikbacteria bacterium RIFOXYD2_FULL_39_9]OGH92075.1 MAG: hypothetical protein A2563_00600 [Candidatus Magasanikbacteria bacterium RIFOXYD1_FULL_40_23]